MNKIKLSSMFGGLLCAVGLCAAGAAVPPANNMMRIPMMSDSDSDRRWTLIPIQGGQGFRLIPSTVVVDVGMVSDDSLGVKGQRQPRCPAAASHPAIPRQEGA